MIRKVLFILFLLTLTGAIGMLVLEKVLQNRAINGCHLSGGTWNFMEQKCD